MKILIIESKLDVAKMAAKIIERQIRSKPKSNIGLATGKTMIPLYHELVNLFREKKIDFSKVKTFNLDEYFRVNEKNRKSFHYYMNKRFFSKVNINKENIFFPDKNPNNYDDKIKKSGGIDLQIAGIGRNGHIGFNEPFSLKESKTRKVRLSKITKKDNNVKFNYAYTVGISTILKSKKIVLLATGKNKSNAIKNIINKKVNSKIPASFIKNHKDVSLILDRYAAIKINKT